MSSSSDRLIIGRPATTCRKSRLRAGRGPAGGTRRTDRARLLRSRSSSAATAGAGRISAWLAAVSVSLRIVGAVIGRTWTSQQRLPSSAHSTSHGASPKTRRTSASRCRSRVGHPASAASSRGSSSRSPATSPLTQAIREPVDHVDEIVVRARFAERDARMLQPSPSPSPGHRAGTIPGGVRPMRGRRRSRAGTSRPSRRASVVNHPARLSRHASSAPNAERTA